MLHLKMSDWNLTNRRCVFEFEKHGKEKYHDNCHSFIVDNVSSSRADWYNVVAISEVEDEGKLV